MFKLGRIFVIVLFFILLCSTIGAILIIDTQTAEIDIHQEAKTILDNILGIDTKKYEIDTTGYASRNEATLKLTSDQTHLTATVEFSDNKFVRLNLSADHSPILKQPGEVLDMASGVMKRYQRHTGDAFYGKLQSMLNGVNGENITKTKGNIQLDVYRHTGAYDYDTTWITWTYIDDNGVIATSKRVALCYSNGYPVYFGDDWQRYELNGVPTISSREAVDIALSAFENYSGNICAWDHEFVAASDCKLFSTGEPSLSYYNYYGDRFARDEKTYALYPAWHVPISLDNTKVGRSFDTYIIVWADTGEIGSIGYKGYIW